MTELVQRYPARFILVWLLAWAALWPLGHLGGDDELTVWIVFLQVIINVRLLETIINKREQPAWRRYSWYVTGVVGFTAVAYIPTSFLLHWFCGAVNPETAVAGQLDTARLCYDRALDPSALLPILMVNSIFLAGFTLYFGGRAIWHWLR